MKLEWLWRRMASDRGQIAPLAAMLLVSLLGVTGLAIDVGVATLSRRHAQVAADAAALAGAAELPDTSLLVSRATSQAALNGFTSGGDVTVTVHHPPTSGPHVGDSNYVEAIVAKNVATAFMKVLSIGHVSVQGRAVATAGGSVPCGLYVLDPSANSVVSGTGSSGVGVDACIQVNSTGTPAVTVTGSATVSGSGAGILVAGTCSEPAGPPQTITPACTHSAPVADPLAALAKPSGVNLPPAGQAGCTTPPVDCTLASSGSMTLSPGVYNKIDNNNTGTITLNSGVYIITTELKQNNSGHLIGHNVLLYFACTSNSAPYWRDCASPPGGENGGSLQLTGGSFDISAPASGTYAGLLVFYDRLNKSVLSLTGSSGLHTTGTIYAAKGNTTLTGSSGGGNGTFASLLVTGTLKLTGSSSVPVSYSPGQNWVPAGGAVLVE